MSRLIGTGKTTKQRLASYALTPSQLPRLLARCMSMHVGACWWLTGGKGFCCRSAVCKRPRLRSMLTMPRCRPHKGTYSPIVTRHSWPHCSPWRCTMRAAAARGTGNSSLDDTRQNSLGTRHGSVLQLSSRPCPLGLRCFYFLLPSAACPSGARRVPRQPRRHMDTALGRQAREAQGWLVKQAGDLRVCVCMCVERREYVRASRLDLTVRLV